MLDSLLSRAVEVALAVLTPGRPGVEPVCLPAGRGVALGKVANTKGAVIFGLDQEGVGGGGTKRATRRHCLAAAQSPVHPLPVSGGPKWALLPCLSSPHSDWQM